MMYRDFVFAEMLTKDRIAKRLHQAEIHRSLCQMKARRPSWVHRQRCWVLCQLGQLLVTLGQRLQRYSTAQPVSLEPAEMLGRE
jgi:hypothetical protein